MQGQIAESFWSITLTIIAVVICTLVYIGSCPRHAEAAQDREIDRWVQANYAAALNYLLPMGKIEPEKFPQNIRWIVTVRILPPFGAPEYRLSLRKTYEGKVEAEVASAKGGSVLSQLQALRKKYPDSTLEKLVELVSVQRWTISQDDLAELRQLAIDFEVIRLSPVLPDELRMDETGYEFWIQSLWGNQMEVRLSGPGSSAKKQPYPLLQWVEAFRRVVEARARN